MTDLKHVTVDPLRDARVRLQPRHVGPKQPEGRDGKRVPQSQKVSHISACIVINEKWEKRSVCIVSIEAIFPSCARRA